MAIWFISVATILIFGGVVLFGAPYLPTFKKQTEDALDLLNLKRGQTLLELGCGDGRVLAAAARRGINAVGYELNPVLALIAWFRCLRYKKLVKVRLGNYWWASWPKVDGVYVFLLDRYMQKLDRRIVRQAKDTNKSIRLVSYAFKIPRKKVQTQKDALFLYIYK